MKTVNVGMHQPYVTLGEIVAVLPRSASSSEWSAEPYKWGGEEYFEVASDGLDPMTLASESGQRFAHQDFVVAARETPQVIWGTFRACDSHRGPEPWLTISAVDSTLFEVTTDDAEVHQLIRANFKWYVREVKE